MNGLFVFLMIISAFATAFSQVLLKMSANRTYKNVLFEYLNPFVILSYVLFGGVLLLNVLIFTRMDMRFGIVMNSLSGVLVLVLSALLLKEKLTQRRILGSILILAGIALFSL